MKKYHSLICMSLIMMAGCSGGENGNSIVQPAKEPVLEGQMRVLEKSKEVDEIFQRGDDARRQAIEEQSK